MRGKYLQLLACYGAANAKAKGAQTLKVVDPIAALIALATVPNTKGLVPRLAGTRLMEWDYSSGIPLVSRARSSAIAVNAKENAKYTDIAAMP